MKTNWSGMRYDLDTEPTEEVFAAVRGAYSYGR